MSNASAKAAGQLVALLFLARELTHRAHLKTRSYAEHVTLEAFYDQVVELADGFAESWQGEHDALLDIPLIDNSFDGEIADILDQQKAWIADHREAATGGDTSLQNQVDAIVQLYQSTIYKLRFLG